MFDLALMEFVQHTTCGGAVVVASDSTFGNCSAEVPRQWNAEVSTHLGHEIANPRAPAGDARVEDLTCQVVVLEEVGEVGDCDCGVVL